MGLQGQITSCPGLFISQIAIGDVITSLPLFKSLERLTGLAIHVATPAALDDIYAHDPRVGRVFILPDALFSIDIETTPSEDSFLDEIVSTQYGLVVDTISSPGTSVLVSQIDSPIKAGIAFESNSGRYTHLLDLQDWLRWGDSQRTATDCFSDIVRLADPDFSPDSPVLHVGDAYRHQGAEWLDAHAVSDKPVVAINPGAGSPLKRWPIERFINVAAEIEQQGYFPVFVFGPKESTMHEAVAGEICSRGWAIWASADFRVQPLAGLLSHCAFLLTNDCAVMHVSAAIGTPTAAIFGPTHSKVWFPYSSERHLVIENEVECRQTCKWGCDDRQCLDSLAADDVLLRLRKWLS
jgi:ADP-heptose:LPS heptosyltransferase